MSSPIRFGLMGGVDIQDDAHTVRWAEHCEAIGADLLATGEGASLLVDPYLWLHAAARASQRLQLGTILTTPGLRHPIVLANTLATLQRISGGRAFFGIGTGDLARLELGLPPSTLAELEAYATAVRTLTEGGSVDWDGAVQQIRWARPEDRVPLMLGGDGPKGVALAGRIADAIVVGQAGHPDIVGNVVGRLNAASAAAGRTDTVDAWFMCRIHVTERENGAMWTDGLDEYGARQAQYFWRTSGSPDEDSVVDAVRSRKGVVLDADVGRRLVRYCREFDFGPAWTKGDKTMVQLLEKYDLREWVGRLFYLSGPHESVVARVRELVAAGGRRFVTPLMLEDRFAASEQVARVFADVNGTAMSARGSRLGDPHGQPT